MIGLFKKFKDSDIDGKLLYVLLLGLSAFLVLAYALSASRSMVNADAGYYLGVVELIHEGFVPYRDFSLGYTPLFFYVLQLPRSLMGQFPNYCGFMLFLYLIAAINASLIATLVKRITDSVMFAWLSALIFLVLYLYLDGAYFVLETFSLCCGLVSMVLLVGEKSSFWRCFISGACCALAFLSKQYGLIFAGVVGILLLFSNDGWKNKTLNCLYAFTGFTALLTVFVLLFVLAGLGLKVLISALNGSAYGGQSLGMYADGVIKACRLFPYLLFVPMLLFGKTNRDRKLAWACCAGLLLASFQFYFNVFPHYYVFMLPFVLVLNAMLWNNLRYGKGATILFFLYFGLLFTSCALPLQSVYKDTKSLVKHDLRAAQDKTTVQLRQEVMNHELDSALCYWNTIQYYGLCPIKPAAIENYGFAFGGDTEDTYIERLEDADCFIIKKSDMDDIQNMKAFSAILSERFLLLDRQFADGTRVFVKKNGAE